MITYTRVFSYSIALLLFFNLKPVKKVENLRIIKIVIFNASSPYFAVILTLLLNCFV